MQVYWFSIKEIINIERYIKIIYKIIKVIKSY
jgi:hypothetical protein